MNDLKAVAALGLKRYKRIVPLEIREEIRLNFMHMACANMILVRSLELGPFTEPEFSMLIFELQEIPEVEWREDKETKKD